MKPLAGVRVVELEGIGPRLLAELFASQPRAHWCELLEGIDVCFAPVLGMAEAARHPRNVARGIYEVREDGAIEVVPAPA